MALKLHSPQGMNRSALDGTPPLSDWPCPCCDKFTPIGPDGLPEELCDDCAAEEATMPDEEE